MKKNISNFVDSLGHVSLSSGLFLLSARIALAADNNLYTNPFTTGKNGVTAQTVPELLVATVNLALLLGTPVIVIFIIYTGFLFVSAGGDPAGIKKARTSLTWTLVGALVLLGAKGLAMAIQATIGSLK
jgi:hypothetical protein